MKTKEEVLQEMETIAQEFETKTTMKTEKRKQKISVSYTLTAFANNVKRMEEAKLITQEELQIIKQIYNKAIEHWIGTEMKL